jgi:hypothetical protein
MIEDPFGASLQYGNAESIFSIGCADGKALVSVGSFLVTDQTRDGTVQLSGTTAPFSQVDRDVGGVVAEGNMTQSWVDDLARADAVAVQYAEQSFGPLALPEGSRVTLAERCRATIGATSRFP